MMIMKIRFIFLTILCVVSFSINAWAHTFWINCYDSQSHEPGHVMVSLGYGHSVPMDDLLDSDGAEMKLTSYELVDPAMKKSSLPMPVFDGNQGMKNASGIIVKRGDLGISKLTFSEDAEEGTYQIGATSKPDYYTLVVNDKGRRKWILKPMDEIKDAKEIIQSTKYQAMAKGFFTKGKWTDPKPLGHELEIIPMTDLASVRAGDLVEFKILLMNEPFSSTPSQIERITAVSNTFGGPDNFYIAADIARGKARLRFSTPGQWIVSVYHVKEVSKDERLKNLEKKCIQAHYVASISFNVRP
ncbi:MAG: DUF4198 domain-containing protein [Deltaproteobacteria bacterium]|nr:DUF4198 domain-containing protein [Deltaproteobacteria bacterium]